MKVTASRTENKEQAKRLQGVIKSLVRSGFINAKELPEKMNETEAVNVINNIINGVTK